MRRMHKLCIACAKRTCVQGSERPGMPVSPTKSWKRGSSPSCKHPKERKRSEKRLDCIDAGGDGALEQERGTVLDVGKPAFPWSAAAVLMEGRRCLKSENSPPFLGGGAAAFQHLFTLSMT